MAIQSGFPIIYTRDMERLRGFYGGVLGLEEAFRFDGDGGAPVFVTYRFGPSELGIALVDPARPGMHGQQVEPSSGHRFELCLYTDDTDEEVARLRAAGATVVHEPQDQVWHERLAYVLDPDGNILHITSTKLRGGG